MSKMLKNGVPGAPRVPEVPKTPKMRKKAENLTHFGELFGHLFGICFCQGLRDAKKGGPGARSKIDLCLKIYGLKTLLDRGELSHFCKLCSPEVCEKTPENARKM